MIPDKIYIHLTTHLGLLDATGIPVNAPDEHEYIRKEALMEWLESKVYEHNEDRFDDGFNAALGQVIDKLNEM